VSVHIHCLYHWVSVTFVCFWKIISSSRLDGCHIVFVSPFFVGQLYESDNIVFIDLFVSVSRVGYPVIFVVYLGGPVPVRN
jgi:hypothetical protein